MAFRAEQALVSVGGPVGVAGGGVLLAGTDEETVVTGESTAVAGAVVGEGSVAAGIDGDITDTASGTGVSGAARPVRARAVGGIGDALPATPVLVAGGGDGVTVVVELECSCVRRSRGRRRRIGQGRCTGRKAGLFGRAECRRRLLDELSRRRESTRRQAPASARREQQQPRLLRQPDGNDSDPNSRRAVVCSEPETAYSSVTYPTS